ncbi:MAG: helix-turn-helix domain-containing protein [Fusicatenibacter sp.]|nr:helix-turn-helix domain-containing protein [Fusicatenibacter sp.]
MRREERIRSEIKKRYPSLREFARQAGIPYSSLATALERGISGMGFDSVMTLCEMLELSPYDFLPKETFVRGKDGKESMQIREMLRVFDGMNEEGRECILNLAKDLSMLTKYQEKGSIR